MRVAAFVSLLMVVAVVPAYGAADDVMDRVEHHNVDNDGVNIHYVTMGKGPLILFIHGFPDFWYTWRNQMDALAGDYRVAALDCRGYNGSDKPKGGENYDMSLLVSDIAAVVRDAGVEKAIICGHDWGGMIAWSFVMTHPEMTEKLMIVNLPHPRGLSRELAKGGQQTKNSAYARRFQQEDSHKMLSAAALAGAVSRGDADLRAVYTKAFENSDFDAMMNYYRRNFPKEPYEEIPDGVMPKITVPVLQFHGLKDTALLPGALNDTWLEIDADYTLVTIPESGHWTQNEAADLVSTTMKWWLASRR